MIQCFNDTAMNHPNYELTGTKIKYALKEFMETTTRY